MRYKSSPLLVGIQLAMATRRLLQYGMCQGYQQCLEYLVKKDLECMHALDTDSICNALPLFTAIPSKTQHKQMKNAAQQIQSQSSGAAA
jgi:hypothetical protein